MSIEKVETSSSRIHVDDWLDATDYHCCSEEEKYAKFVIEFLRLPAFKIMNYEKFMENNKLFCTYNNKRWKVTGASRMGTISLHSDFNKRIYSGYEEAVFVNQCSEWSNKP